MAQIEVLKDALRKLVKKYAEFVKDFELDNFLKANVDPFRFAFSVMHYGERHALHLEIEHKLAMKLENMMGDFHEDFLGNAMHIGSNCRWEKVPAGLIPGIDIKNTGLNAYLQIKSKHNSMNSSSSNRLAQELKKFARKNPCAVVGCGWVIASEERKCIGEKKIAEVAREFKGRKLFAYVTGNPDEMDELIGALPGILKQEIETADIEKLVDDMVTRIHKQLIQVVSKQNLDIIGYLYQNAVE